MTAPYSRPAAAFATPMPRPVPDRPLTVLDMMDGALNVARLRPKTIAVIMAAFVVPTQLAAAWLQRDLFTSLDFSQFESTGGPFSSGGGEFSVFGGSDFGVIVATIIPNLTLPMIGVAMTYLVAGWHAGTDRSPLTCIAFTMRRMPVILSAWVLCKLVQILSGVLLVIPLLFTTAFLLVVAPVIAAEGLGPVKAMKRSYALTNRRRGPVIGLLLSVVFVGQLLGSALGTLPTLAAFLLGDWGWVAFFAVSLVSETVLSAFAVGAAVLLYFDLRNRTEGHDLALRLDQLSARRGV